MMLNHIVLYHVNTILCYLNHAVVSHHDRITWVKGSLQYKEEHTSAALTSYDMMALTSPHLWWITVFASEGFNKLRHV